jgi:hypothetical protein
MANSTITRSTRQVVSDRCPRWSVGWDDGVVHVRATVAQATEEAEHCVYAVSSQTYTCQGSLSEAKATGSQLARAQGDVIGATVFEFRDYGGASLTITVPKPCPKNDKVDFWLDLDGWRNKISSVQAWSSCWIWLHPESGGRAGPFKDKHPDVGSYIDNRTVTVGLS